MHWKYTFQQIWKSLRNRYISRHIYFIRIKENVNNLDRSTVNNEIEAILMKLRPNTFLLSYTRSLKKTNPNPAQTTP